MFPVLKSHSFTSKEQGQSWLMEWGALTGNRKLWERRDGGEKRRGGKEELGEGRGSQEEYKGCPEPAFLTLRHMAKNLHACPLQVIDETHSVLSS